MFRRLFIPAAEPIEPGEAEAFAKLPRAPLYGLCRVSKDAAALAYCLWISTA